MMNMMKVVMIGAAVVFSTGAFAAKEITKQEAKKYTEVGVVSTSGEATSPKEAMNELSKLADEKGGKYFVVTSGRVEGKVKGTAAVYK